MIKLFPNILLKQFVLNFLNKFPFCIFKENYIVNRNGIT